MKRNSLVALLAILAVSCRSVRVRCDGPSHYVNARPPKIEYPILTDMVYSTNPMCHYKILKNKRGRLFYYEQLEYGRQRRVYIKIKR